MRIVSEEGSSLLASLDRHPLTPLPPLSKNTHTTCHLWPLWKLQKKPDLIALWCLLRMFESNLHLN